MLAAVEVDLARMTDLNTGVRGALAALARRLASAMDATGEDQPTPAQVGQLGAQLRVTLNSLADVAGDKDAADAFFRLMSTAVRSVNDDNTCAVCGHTPGDTHREPTAPPRPPTTKGPEIPGVDPTE